MGAHTEDKAEHRRNVMAERMSTPEGTQGVIDEIDALRQRRINRRVDRAMATAAKGYMAEPKGGRGKVFHTKAHERKKGEKYYTPAWVTRCLLKSIGMTQRLANVASIWEPAAGDGQIVDELRRQAFTVEASDINPDHHSITRLDFLAVNKVLSRTCAIISNPPFGVQGRLAFLFCWHALRLMESRRGVVAMLMRDDFDSAKGRRVLFAHPAFDRKIVITDRIRWTNLPQDPKKGPSGSHAWFIWDWSRDAMKAPTLHYASADEDPLEAVTK